MDLFIKVKRLSAAFILIASYGSADELSIQRSYSYLLPEHRDKDTSCREEFEEKMVSSYRGMRSVELRSNHIFDTTDGAISIYNDVRFQGDYGYAIGSIHCILNSDGTTVTDIFVVFRDGALGGNESIGMTSNSDDPYDWTLQAFGMQVSP